MDAGVNACCLTCRLKLHPVMSNQDVCQVGTLLTLLDGSLVALTGEMPVTAALNTRAQLPCKCIE